MKFHERKEFHYDPELFKANDTQRALLIHQEYLEKHASKPRPKFLEASQSVADIDPLWHVSTSDRTIISRELDIPAIVKFEKLQWRLTRLGRIPQQNLRFWLANLTLQKFDYFPTAGDQVYWNGYRLGITGIDFEPRSYWQQTNVWLGLIAVAAIIPEGDARPSINPGKVVSAETGSVIT